MKIIVHNDAEEKSLMDLPRDLYRTALITKIDRLTNKEYILSYPNSTDRTKELVSLNEAK